MGDGLEARASLGRFSVCCIDIIEKSCELGMDARDVYDEWDDECDEETIDAAREVAAIALTSVHGLYIMDLQSSQEGSMLPPAVPLSLLDMPPRSLQDSLVAMRGRLSLTLPSDFPHKVCSEHTGLKRNVSNSHDLKSKLEEAANRAGVADYFRACWEPQNGNYPHLQHCAGGLSTVFQAA
jgi:hypothetical protein